MKSLTVRVAKEEMTHVLAEAHHGDVIVLTDGERQIQLEAVPPHGGALDLDLEENSPELEAELLKAVQGPHAPYSESELCKIAERARHARSSAKTN